MSSADFLSDKLDERIRSNLLRRLSLNSTSVDFTSNDYLGMVKLGLLHEEVSDESFSSGSTGSRLLSGNYALIEQTEKEIALFHDAETGLIFNSGYDANLGLLSCIANKGDTILHDQYSHASIRDGIRLSFAQSQGFGHNNLLDLEKKLKSATGTVFVVTESLFSMDGDIAPLNDMVALCKEYHAHLIVDEAHATGITGDAGEGLVQVMNVQANCFARVHTFGKALGCHGAIVLGSQQLRNYLINFSRPFIYTTALPPMAVSVIRKAYSIFPKLTQSRKRLSELIGYWCASSWMLKTSKNAGAIQYILLAGNEEVKKLASFLQDSDIDARPILYPSVPKGAERIRIILHAFNTIEEIELLRTRIELFSARKHLFA